MEYIALIHTQGHTMWITDGESNNPRLFEDEKLAEEVAKIFSPNFKILTKEEFINSNGN